MAEFFGGHMSSESISEKTMDKEWVEMILLAREMGLSIDEIRDFFKKCPRPE